MTSIEILHKIVDADRNARDVYEGAVELREGFDSYVAGHVEELRAKSLAQADEKIASEDKRLTAEADKAIEKLDKKLEDSLAAAASVYDKRKNAMVERIFKLTVQADA